MPKFPVKINGPLFEHPEELTDDFITEIKKEIAQEGVNRVQRMLSQVLQHPTGYYESQIRTEESSDDVFVTDSGVVYGGWLEGTTERNKTTRFKGYHVFRETRQQLESDIPQIIQDSLNKYISELNK